MAQPLITVVVPSYRPLPGHLHALHTSLEAQTLQDFEVVVVDDGSPEADYSPLSGSRYRILRQPHNRGPAVCRNVGAAAARTSLLFFTDTDCTLAPGALAVAHAALADHPIVVGDTRTRVETWFGRLVALLGFPGGGCIGFHQVWRVDADGTAYSFSSCNVAFRRQTFEALGRFPESFPVAGGEDTVLARRAVEAGTPPHYRRDQVVWHVEKPGLRGFIRWQLVRGRGNYHIRQHVSRVRGYLWLRVWTFKNSFVAAGWRDALPVALLLGLSVALQGIGYYREKARMRRAARTS